MVKEYRTFKFCGKGIDTNDYIIANALRFESIKEVIYALYYDDWNGGSFIKVPIYEPTSEEDLKRALKAISQFYTNNPDGVFDFTLL